LETCLGGDEVGFSEKYTDLKTAPRRIPIVHDPRNPI
jgi:hypothetical protein